jgi:hypothetical protein
MVKPGPPILMVAAPLLWFGYFLLIYGLNALACRSLWPPGPVVAAETALTILALAAEAVPLIGLVRECPSGFYRATGLALGGLSLLATLWVGAMAWLVPPCA